MRGSCTLLGSLCVHNPSQRTQHPPTSMSRMNSRLVGPHCHPAKKTSMQNVNNYTTDRRCTLNKGKRTELLLYESRIKRSTLVCVFEHPMEYGGKTGYTPRKRVSFSQPRRPLLRGVLTLLRLFRLYSNSQMIDPSLPTRWSMENTRNEPINTPCAKITRARGLRFYAPGTRLACCCPRRSCVP